MNARRPAVRLLPALLAVAAVVAAIGPPPALAAAANPAASSAATSSAAAARAVLDRYLTATGGRAAWEADSTMHTRMAITAFGLTGGADHWGARPDRIATATRLGPLTLGEGTVGETGWRVDQNGKLAWLDGLELEEARAAVYFDLEMWLAPAAAGGTVKYVGREEDEGRQLEELEIAAPVGKPRRMFFDAQTGLLVKGIQTSDQQAMETRLTAYETVAGRRRAREAHTRVMGVAGNDITTRIDSVWVGFRPDSAMFLPPRPAAGGMRFLDGGSSAQVPVTYSARHVWVRASVDGRPPADFLLDTGASVTVIDSAYAATIGLATEGELTGQGAAARGKFTFAKLGTLRVEGPAGTGVEIAERNVVVASLNPYLAPVFWRPCAGILGYDFISRLVVTVDFENGTLGLADPERFTYAGKGAALPIAFAAGVPLVRATLDGAYEGDFRLDVGSGSGVDLHTPFVVKHELEKSAKRTVLDQGGGFGGTWDRVGTRMKSFAVGPYTVTEPLVHLSRAAEGAMASADYAGNVGNRVLDRFTCTFDYTHKQLYLEPNRRFGERDEYTRFGAQLARGGDRVVVAFVVPGSAAADAGLAPGDEVVALAGRPAASYTVDEVSDLFESRPVGTTVAVEYKRGEQTLTAQVKLKSQL
jgi:hypothetical protein